ncbi:thermonuclease family protein [Caulobacter segnis]|uniref:thermonuclease family protein n=1 Tax=Caulobacter segnis TaxID=88688 RepID=UPI002857EAE6|nr:thermonuclease family protein [Caulobacter segnis]MDR6623857.1 endonuclease YncB(thermonuclease family) [Caulobacter segnis]
MLFAAALTAIIACNALAVHDGDTLCCGSERVRLFGVDAPEVSRGNASAEPLAHEARDELIRLTRGRVGCRFVDRDRYGRFVGRCWSDASPDINAALIRSGLATEYRRYSKGAYAAAEDEAQSAGRGAWSRAIKSGPDESR